MAIIRAIAKRQDVSPQEGKTKYGDVTFADPKNKKYPIDTEEHIRAAWNYINKAGNAAKYSSADVASIKRRIISAWKSKIDKEGPPSAAEASFLVMSDYRVNLDGQVPEKIMYMPAGMHSLTPSVNGESRRISVNVGQITADLLQGHLAQLLSGNVRPFIDFDHAGGAAAAIPKKFSWEPEGVMLELEWTRAGKAAVEGRDYSYFSPTFMLNEDGDPSGLPTSGSIGALTNNPAFREIKRIAATNLDDGDDTGTNNKNQRKKMSERITAKLVSLGLITEADAGDEDLVMAALDAHSHSAELETLRAENKQLRDAAEAQRVEAANRDADTLIESAIKDGKIAPKNETVKASLKKWLLNDREGAKAHIDSLPANPAFKTVVHVSAGHKDIGRPAAVKSTASGDMSSGKLCKAKVSEIQSRFPGMTFEQAWMKAETENPELFQSVEAN
jgi:hypothetical protein